jgi:hypothetical protein
MLKIMMIVLILQCTLASKDFSFLEKGKTKVYKSKNGTTTKEILGSKTEINGVEYFQELVKYSWGKEVVNHYRLVENGDLVYLDNKSKTESVIMPYVKDKGYSWTSADGAWKYEIHSTGQIFATPDNTYSNCLIIKATQLTQRDKKKHKFYLNYYVEDIGHVASVIENEIMNYLSEIK